MLILFQVYPLLKQCRFSKTVAVLNLQREAGSDYSDDEDYDYDEDIDTATVGDFDSQHRLVGGAIEKQITKSCFDNSF